MSETAVASDTEVERALVGAMLLGRDTVEAVRAVVAADDFYSPALAAMFSATVAVADSTGEVDVLLVADELRRQGMLDFVGGPAELISAQIVGCSASVAQRHADIVANLATNRRVQAAALELADEGRRGQLTPESLAGKLAAITPPPSRGRLRVAVPGGSFVFDTPSSPQAVWGKDRAVLWADGEPTMLCGPTGVGKTTVAQQVVLARVGLHDEALGFPVAPEVGRVLYLACDRPTQAARSMRRMVTEDDRAVLDERLVFWRGPLPGSLVSDPLLLVKLAEEHGAQTVIIDSLKDVVAKLSIEEDASAFNTAVQNCAAAGIETLTLHHQRKAQNGGGKPNTIADVYGNAFLTAGQGSVLLLWGNPGDPVVELSHLKQPAETVGPLTLIHDHVRGVTTAEEGVDLLGIVTTSNGLTAQAAATYVFPGEANKNNIEKARRKLDALVRTGLVHKAEGGKDPSGRQLPDRYYAMSRRPEPCP